MVEDEAVIEAEVTNFFNALINGHHDNRLVTTGSAFVPDYSGLDSYLDGLGSLPDFVRDEMEKDILIEELRVIVKECANNKSPGLDGLGYEFYKTTFDIIH